MNVRFEAEYQQFKKATSEAAAALEEVGSAADKAASRVESSGGRIDASAKKTAKETSAAAKETATATEQAATATESAGKKATGTVVTVGEFQDRLTEKTRKNRKEQESWGQALVKSARDNEQHWRRAGTALTAFGTVVTGVGVAALRTGVQYNTLQQTTRASLTTMLGSAEAAADQMDRLDDFARNSPFSKSVFIQAQQQMLAFGIETRKVVPYLDAVQNAVAAAGGGNQQIAEIVSTMAKIQASAKITATDLMEFGNRGVDAATLIGSQMGMTGAEIRESITAGTLDATVALDALVAAMSDRFDGAAAGVKQTFDGAMDRVKAAWRDLSSELAAPLVSPEGGGLLIDWLNGVADAMRQFQGLPEPVKNTAAAVGLLAGAVALGGGALMLGLPKWAAYRESLAMLAKDSPRAAAGIGRVATVAGRLAGAAIGVAAFAAAAAATHRALDDLQTIAPSSASAMAALLDVVEGAGTSGLDEFFSKSGRLSGEVESMSQAMEEYVETSGHWLGQLFSGVDETQTWFKERMESIGQALREQAEAGHGDEVARQVAVLERAWVEAGGSAEDLIELMPAYRDYLLEGDNAARQAATGASQFTEAQIAAAEALAEWKDEFAGIDASFMDVLGAYDQVIEKNREMAQEAADATKSTKDSWEDFYDGVSVSMKDWITSLEEQARAQQAWRENVLAVSRQIRDEMPADMHVAARSMVDELIDAGPQGAAALQAFREASAEERVALVEAWAGTGQDITDELANIWAPEIEITADTSDLDASLAEITSTAASVDARVQIGSDTSPVMQDLEGVTASVDQARGTITLYGDDGQALQTLYDYTATVDAATGQVTVTGNDELGRQVVVSFSNWIDHQGGTVKVNADVAAAEAAIRRVVASANTQARIRVLGQAEFADGGWTGPGGKYQPAGIVHADEFVVRKESRASIENAAPGLLDALNARGASALMLGGYASGGRVEWARARRIEAQQAVSRAQSALKSAEASKNDARIERAQRELDAQERRLANATARWERISRETWDLRVDVRRGDTLARAQSGLSGGLSVVDQLRQASRNEDLTAGARQNLAGTAARAERDLMRLYQQAERIESRLADARDRVAELGRISSQVASRLSGEQSLASAITSATEGSWTTVTRTNSRGETWNEEMWDPGQAASVTSTALVAGARAKAEQIKAFAERLNELRRLGLSGVVLQEVASLGTEQGTLVADALIAGGKRDITDLNRAYADIQHWSEQSGQYVTEGFFAGGVAAAEGLVAGLESQQAALEKQVEKIAKAMEAALKRAWGIRSPSRVWRGFGQNAAGSVALGFSDKEAEVARAAQAVAYMPTAVAARAAAVASYGGQAGATLDLSGWSVTAPDPELAAQKAAQRVASLLTSRGVHRVAQGVSLP